MAVCSMDFGKREANYFREDWMRVMVLMRLGNFGARVPAAWEQAGLTYGCSIEGFPLSWRRQSVSERPRTLQSSYLADRSATIRTAINSMQASARRWSAFMDDLPVGQRTKVQCITPYTAGESFAQTSSSTRSLRRPSAAMPWCACFRLADDVEGCGLLAFQSKLRCAYAELSRPGTSSWKAPHRRSVIRSLPHECPPATAACAGIEHAALALIARKVVAEQRRHVDDHEFPPLAIV